MVIPEKTYTNNPFVDNVIYYAKLLAMNCTVKDEEEATLKYKLKIKDMQNKNLLEKTISTNEKVVLTYKDMDLMLAMFESLVLKKLLDMNYSNRYLKKF